MNTDDISGSVGTVISITVSKGKNQFGVLPLHHNMMMGNMIMAPRKDYQFFVIRICSSYKKSQVSMNFSISTETVLGRPLNTF